jgi:hypothetical protein
MANLPPPPDARAVRILNNTYWADSGWRKEPSFPEQDDFVFAASAGVMFRPKILTHDEVIAWAHEGVRQVTAQTVADAFTASLLGARTDLRSAVASYHLARALPKHRYEHRPTGFSADGKPMGSYCVVCGHTSRDKDEYDLSVLNFERLKWGGVRFTDPIYIAFDLSQAKGWSDIEPHPQDVDALRQLLRTIRDIGASDPEARPQQLEKAISGNLPRANRYQRRAALAILAFCGILQPQSGPGFARGWVRYLDRPEAPEWKNDWPYPIHAWRGRDQVDDERTGEIFSRLR